jgi:NAD(P)-dependent dehydrogenase (short-subunit alcohol dehydrogenase family)
MQDLKKQTGLNGQTALVTGASRGLGKAIVRHLSAKGAAVCVNYVARKQEAETLAEEIRGCGGRAIAVCADVGDPSQALHLWQRAEADLGPVSILVNNAGLVYRATLENFEHTAMERMHRTNVDGVINMTQAAVPGMKTRGYGRIVNLTSIAARGTSLPGTAFYSATKAAVSILTLRFAMELGTHGITVNAVAPGFILTDMAKEGRTEQEIREVVKKTMIGRAGEPDDIANVVGFLVMPESGFITAQVLTVDGGRIDYIGHP